MKISTINIFNFRGIKEAKFGASPFNCIIGENNAGKSSILVAVSLFFSGTALSKSDFYDESQSIRIELTFTGITKNDLLRLSDEHRDKIDGLLIDSSLKLIRLYSTDGKSELLCERMMPTNSKYDLLEVKTALKGKSGSTVAAVMASRFSESASEFTGITTQGAAISKLEELISKLPANQLTKRDSSLPTGIENSLKGFLPETIYIAAVKDLKDEVKAKDSSNFGKILAILLRSLEKTPRFAEIVSSFDKLHKLLNTPQEQDVPDERVEELKQIETKVGKFLKENFPRSSIHIEIPKPELKQIFSNARILVDDGVKDIVETKGDGIKRAVTFALLRTYVEQLKEQKKFLEVSRSETASTSPEEPSEQPYIFLFEEPELYLHPSGQKILFEALENISEESNQVFVTTHSPLFFSPQSTGTFIKVIKEYPKVNKPFGKLITINLIEEIPAKDAFQIICYENNSAAFFCNKVVLVEGDSDLIFIKAIAERLNTEWNFDFKNIPIISINGKSNVKRFIDFYKYFQIKTYCILDLDALIDGFEKFEVADDVRKLREDVLKSLDKIIQQKELAPEISADKVKEMARKYTWKQRYDRLKELSKKVKENKITEEESREIDLLFSDEILSQRRLAFKDDVPGKKDLLQKLRGGNIFILSNGSIEQYYPDGVTGEDKPSRALNAIKLLPKDGARNHLIVEEIEGVKKCELDLIFEKIFENY